MAMIFIKTKVETKIQTIQDQFGRKGQVISNTASIFNWSSKKNIKGCQELAKSVLENQIQLNALSIQRGFESLDNQITVDRRLLEQLIYNRDK